MVWKGLQEGLEGQQGWVGGEKGSGNAETHMKAFPCNV